MNVNDPSPQAPASPPAPLPSEPSGELVTHFTSSALRQRMVASVRKKGIPERNAEDVVHTTLTDAWNRRFDWPQTIPELEQWLFAMLRCDRIDETRRNARSPLVRKKATDAAPNGEVSEHDDADPPAMIVAAPVPVEAQVEARDSLRFAVEYAESRPRLRHSIVWLLQSTMGVPVSEIARRAGVPDKTVTNALHRLREELRAAHGPLAIVLAILAVAAIAVYVMHGRVHDTAKPDTTLPRPAPSAVAPTAPSPPVTTDPPATAAPIEPAPFGNKGPGP